MLIFCVLLLFVIAVAPVIGQIANITTIYQGYPLNDPYGIVLSDDGTVAYILDRGDNILLTPSLYAVTPLNGGTATVTTIYSGSPFVDPYGLDLSYDGTIAFVVDAGRLNPCCSPPSLFAVTPLNGGPATVTTIWDFAPFVRPRSICVAGTVAYIVDEGDTYNPPSLFAVSGVDGGPVTVTTLYSGPPFVTPRGIAISPDFSVAYIVDAGYEQLNPCPPYPCVSVNQSLFAVTPLNGPGTITRLYLGSPFVAPTGISLSADGMVAYIVDPLWPRTEPYNASLFAVAPLNGGPVTVTTMYRGNPFGSPKAITLSLDDTIAYIPVPYTLPYPSNGSTLFAVSLS